MMRVVRDRWASRLEQAVALGRRSQQELILAALTGVLTGGAVALFEWIASDLTFDNLLRQPRWVRGAAPVVGLVLAAAALRWVAGGATAATSDEYIRNFHDRHSRLDERPVLGRIVASLA